MTASSLQLAEEEPPYSQEAEMATLGAMMLEERAVGELSWLKADRFYLPAHQKVYEALVELYSTGKAIDLVMVKNFLREKEQLKDCGGWEYLVQLMESVPAAAHGAFYADIVRDKWVLRKLESRCQSVLRSIRSPDMGAAEKVEQASTLVEGLLDSSTLEFRAGDVLDSLTDAVKPGLPTGIAPVDEFSDCGGLYPDEPNFVCGLTGVGKSLFCCQLAKNWCADGKRVLLVSLELRADKVVRRLMKMLCGYSSVDQARRDGRGAEWEAARAEFYGWDLTIYDPARTRGGSRDVESVCEWVIAKHGHREVDALIVDYAQFFKSRRPSRGKTDCMETVEDELRMLNQRCGFVMLVAAQLIWAGEGKARKLYVRNSREFGLGAAYDLHLLRDEDQNYTLKCEKNRNGRVYWETELKFDRTHLT